MTNTRKQKPTMMEKLDKAGIKIVYTNFRERPVEHTVPSILLLGRVFQKEAQAAGVHRFPRSIPADLLSPRATLLVPSLSERM